MAILISKPIGILIVAMLILSSVLLIMDILEFVRSRNEKKRDSR